MKGMPKKMTWDSEAEKALRRVPFFVREDCDFPLAQSSILCYGSWS